MSDNIFNIISAIGIGLTFLTSMAAVIVSIISLKNSNKIAKHSGYLNTITVSRNKWVNSLRENSSLYFTQIARICNGQEENTDEIYNELTRYHFEIILLLYDQEDDVDEKVSEELHNIMSAVRSNALEIVNQSNIIKQYYKNLKVSTYINNEQLDNQAMVINAQQKICELKNAIIEDYQPLIFDKIKLLLKCEWEKQKKEANLN